MAVARTGPSVVDRAWRAFLLGLMTLNLAGLGGSVLQMFSHGIIGGLLFAVVGRMITIYKVTFTILQKLSRQFVFQ